MKAFIVLAALVAIAAADVSHLIARGPAHRSLTVEQPDVTVVKELLHDNIGLGDYKFNYELSDGQKREEVAQVEARSADEVVNRVTGSYSWVAADGITYTVRYTADENGFHPEGDHLPVAPVA